MTAAHTSDSTTPDTIVLIHGLWLTPLSWEHWIERYEGRGYRVIAPTWPGMDAPIEDLRRDPSAMAGGGITEITDHYNGIIGALDTPPIIMGHSFGGAITQLLLDRTLGAAGVAIHPAPVKGVLRLPLSALRSSFPVLLRNPRNRNRAVALTPRQFHYGFANTMSEEESQAVYERYHVPGRVRSRRSTSRARPAPRCWSWAAARTIPFRPQWPKRPPRARARPSRPPSIGSTRTAHPTRWARRAGRRSPTTLSSGLPSTPRPVQRPEHMPGMALPAAEVVRSHRKAGIQILMTQRPVHRDQ